MSATNREVILGIGAGIAAYKSADVLRRLQDQGFGVTVVPTPSSLNFVGAATWEALSHRAVTTQVWEKVEEVRHISLAKEADYFLIAPATADLIARLAGGRADDLLTNLVLASDVPKMIVPAMHPSMWLDSATVANVAILRSRGFHVMEPEVGRLTGSDSGQGRFPETMSIVKEFLAVTGVHRDLEGKNIIVTAGGTREAIDPVRFIGNRSSGKQGISVAKAAVKRGALVNLIAANVEIENLDGVQITHVVTAAQMLQALESSFGSCDILVMSAAVADAKPVVPANEKIKKADFTSIELVENPDLLATLAPLKKSQIVVGFAAETNDMITSASSKLEKKGLDLIYVNDVSGGAIFGSDETEGTILLRNGNQVHVSRQTKDTLANLLLDYALKQLG
ncbi:MAG: bifunctional phosphopantothenoylcysteine decarboxylase/phosphopantothenate--cysteine ligase CoaBC [Actinomycetes bacterium]